MKDEQLQHHEYNNEKRKFPIVILANDLQAPTNVGSIFRIADALGILKIYLTGSTTTPPNSKINKTARSTVQYVDYEYAELALSLIAKLKAQHFKIICLEITANSVPIEQLSIQQDDKICLIVGAENHGIDQAILDQSDCVVHIPMMGQNSSMNVAVATGIACYSLQQSFAKGT